MNTSGFIDATIRAAAKKLNISFEEASLLAAIGEPQVVKKCRELDKEVKEKIRKDRLTAARNG